MIPKLDLKNLPGDSDDEELIEKNKEAQLEQLQQLQAQYQNPTNSTPTQLINTSAELLPSNQMSNYKKISLHNQ